MNMHVLEPTLEDLEKAAAYAAITLPWTFNRMNKNTGSRGQAERGLNIAKGILAQEMLRRLFNDLGYESETQDKSHRDEDLFDFRFNSGDGEVLLDVKTLNYFRDYEPYGREPLSLELITQNNDYSGPEWNHFFPMMVPADQLRQEKEAYLFGIADSVNPGGSDIDNDRASHKLVAYPFGPSLPFLSGKALVAAREDSNRGITLGLEYTDSTLFFGTPIELSVIGEWDGNLVTYDVTLKSGEDPKEVGPMSCVSGFEIARDQIELMSGSLSVSVVANELRTTIRNSTRKNINIAPDESLVIERGQFTNLILPSSYKLIVAGTITKNDFKESMMEYPAWVWPNDKIDKNKNQTWSMVTEKDAKLLTRLDIPLPSAGEAIGAGLMKTSGFGPGACCYYYPNIGHGGGIKNQNAYVLPKDLSPLE